jgi:hypothetical protein
MAVHKAIRSNHLAQLQRRRRNAPANDPHLKANLFDDLRQLNRGYGTALAALHRLQRPAIFPAACLRDLCNRTEALRAVVNRDLLRFLAGREDRDATRFATET